MTREDKILLYWSGELNDAVGVQEVETLLESDPKSRTYLEELEAMSSTVSAEPSALPSPSILQSALDSCLPSKGKVIKFPPWAFLSVAASCAALFVICFSLLNHSPDIQIPGVAQTETRTSETRPPLLEKSETMKRIETARTRAQKIRSRLSG